MARDADVHRGCCRRVLRHPPRARRATVMIRRIRAAWRAEVRGWRTARAIIAEEQAKPPAAGPRSMPAAGPDPGEGRTGAHPGTHTGPPSPGLCRWCGGTGLAIVFDPAMEDAYPIPCPGDLHEPADEVPF